MKSIVDCFSKVLRSVLTALYQPFWAAIIMACVFMFLYLYGKERGWTISNFIKNSITVWLEEFKKSKRFRLVFLFAFYVTMILFRTVLNREIWFDPLSKIMSGWWIYDEEGKLTTEAIENFILFLPFTFLLYLIFRYEIFSKVINLKMVIVKSFQIVGLFSLIIEFVQVLFHLGTFQLSDLLYNTLGGIIGGCLYYYVYISCKKNDEK